MAHCTLCLSQDLKKEVRGKDSRKYWFCDRCFLIHADEKYFLPAAEEKKRYLEHNNGIEQAGYVNFLNRAVNPALPYLNPEMRGLDFGCGPAPTISRLLEKHDIICDHYDPLFYPALDADASYNFIFATECFEHFFYPSNEMKRLQLLLNKNGYLIVMTEIWESFDLFKNWYYTRDRAHVSFFHKKTMTFLESNFNWNLIYNTDNRVFIFQKK
ncbi:MAG: class I SAM-dependent methyltransferase [Bacteroidia bacterium]